jgi:hypothetical protein
VGLILTGGGAPAGVAALAGSWGLVAAGLGSVTVGALELNATLLSKGSGSSGSQGTTPAARGGGTQANPAQDKRLTRGEVRELEKAGHHPHGLKPKQDGSKYDLFKRPDGEIVVKPKDGSGPGDPTGVNLNDL